MCRPTANTLSTMADSRGMSEAARAYRFPGEHVYKGVTYRDIVPVASLQGIEEHLELNSQDIVVASYPKSGIFKTHAPLTKWPPFWQTTLSNAFFNETDSISIRISLQFDPRSPIDTYSVLVQVMAWRRKGDKPLSEPMLTWFSDAYMRH